MPVEISSMEINGTEYTFNDTVSRAQSGGGGSAAIDMYEPGDTVVLPYEYGWPGWTWSTRTVYTGTLKLAKPISDEVTGVTVTGKMGVFDSSGYTMNSTAIDLSTIAAYMTVQIDYEIGALCLRWRFSSSRSGTAAAGAVVFMCYGDESNPITITFLGAE